MTSKSTFATASEDWAKHIAAWRASNLSRAAYCREHDLKVHVLLYRIHRQQSDRAELLTLVPVSTNTAPLPRGDLTLRSPQGWSLSMSSDVPAAWLGQLLGALS